MYSIKTTCTYVPFSFPYFFKYKKTPSVLASHVPVHSHRLDLLALSFEVAWRLSSYPSLMPSVISKMIVVHTQIVSVGVFFLPKIYLYIYLRLCPLVADIAWRLLVACRPAAASRWPSRCDPGGEEAEETDNNRQIRSSSGRKGYISTSIYHFFNQPWHLFKV